jgi:hypothetical protein
MHSRSDFLRLVGREIASERELVQKQIEHNESMLSAALKVELERGSTQRKGEVASGTNREQLVFISYCHKDGNWLQELTRHLRPLERAGTLNIWSDRKIKAGTRWRDEIKSAIDKAIVAVMFVGPDFLASDFISENELPTLLERAAERGAVILPIIRSPCRFVHAERLAEFQAVNDPARTVEEMSKPERERLFMKIVDAIEASIKELTG